MGSPFSAVLIERSVFGASFEAAAVTASPKALSTSAVETRGWRRSCEVTHCTMAVTPLATSGAGAGAPLLCDSSLVTGTISGPAAPVRRIAE